MNLIICKDKIILPHLQHMVKHLESKLNRVINNKVVLRCISSNGATMYLSQNGLIIVDDTENQYFKNNTNISFSGTMDGYLDRDSDDYITLKSGNICIQNIKLIDYSDRIKCIKIKDNILDIDLMTILDFEYADWDIYDKHMNASLLVEMNKLSWINLEDENAYELVKDAVLASSEDPFDCDTRITVYLPNDILINVNKEDRIKTLTTLMDYRCTQNNQTTMIIDIVDTDLIERYKKVLELTEHFVKEELCKLITIK